MSSNVSWLSIWIISVIASLPPTQSSSVLPTASLTSFPTVTSLVSDPSHAPTTAQYITYFPTLIPTQLPSSIAPSTRLPSTSPSSASTVRPPSLGTFSPSRVRQNTHAPSALPINSNTFFSSTISPTSLSPLSLSPTSSNPTHLPTFEPSRAPSFLPTFLPTSKFPTSRPTTIPPTTGSPISLSPSAIHSSIPTVLPTLAPTFKTPTQSLLTLSPSTTSPTSKFPSLFPTSHSATPTQSPTPITQRPSLVITAPGTYSPSVFLHVTGIPSSLPTSARLTSFSPTSAAPTKLSSSLIPTTFPTTAVPSHGITLLPSASPTTQQTNGTKMHTLSPITGVHSTQAPTTSLSSAPTTLLATNFPSSQPSITRIPSASGPSTNIPSTSSPTLSPTLSPSSFSPINIRPTLSPFTSTPTAPTLVPTTTSPITSSPSTNSPTQFPTTFSPITVSPTSTAPSTLKPTLSPSSSSPTVPTSSPSSTSPTRSPITRSPSTSSPTSSPSSKSPTKPTSSPSTASPTTISPATASPTSGPTTISPSSLSPSSLSPTTSLPTTVVPTLDPTTKAPTVSPTTALPTTLFPTLAPTTSLPSASPTTRSPSNSPSTHSPTLPTSSPTSSSPSTLSPTSLSPSRSPATASPSASPITSVPSNAPTTSLPSVSPTTPFPTTPTKLPTTAPTTSLPTASPTQRPTTVAPIVSVLTQSPTSVSSTNLPSTALPTYTLAPTIPSASPITFSPSSLSPSSLSPSSFSPTTLWPTTHTPTTRSPISASPSLSPSTRSPTPLPDYCDNTTVVFTIPNTVIYSATLYPNKTDGCDWQINAGSGNVPLLSVSASISVDPPFCDDCVGHCFDSPTGAYKFTCQELILYCHWSIVQEGCPRTCNLCNTCNYNYLTVTGSDGVEYFRTCGQNSSAPIVAPTTSVLTITLHRGFLQRSDSAWLSQPPILLAASGDSIQFSWTKRPFSPSSSPSVYAPPCSGVTRLTSTSTGGGGGSSTGEGIFQSNSIGYYENNANCVWILTAPINQSVFLFFTFFSLQEASDGLNECFADFVQIYDGDIQEETPLTPTTTTTLTPTPSHTIITPTASPSSSSAFFSFGIFCGSSSFPDNVTSSNRSLSVVFSSDSLTSSYGFTAHYRFVSTPGPPPHFCNGIMNVTTQGEVYEDGGYPASLCTWVITAPDNFIRISFVNLSIEGYYPNCDYDKITISTVTGIILMRTCGNFIPPPITSLSNQLVVSFYADDVISGDGFRFRVDFTDNPGVAPLVCQGDQTVMLLPNASGLIEADLWSAYDPSQAACSWLLISPPGTHMHLSVLALNLGHCEGTVDQLRVYDGNTTESSILISEMCGVALNPATDTQDHMMLIQYLGGESDGFIGHYEVEGEPDELPMTSCSGVTLLDSSVALRGTITDGTQGTPFPVNCTWVITAPQDSFVSLNVTYLQTGLGLDGCPNRYFAAFDGPDEFSYPFFATCGTMSAQAFVTTSNTAVVRFVNMIARPASFMLTWAFVTSPGVRSSRCFNLLGTATLIDSPIQITQLDSFTNFRRGLLCSWLVVAPPSQSIQLEWGNLSWQTPQPFNCNSSINISTSASDIQTPALLTLCTNTSKPASFSSHSLNPLFITMFTFQDLQFTVNVTFPSLLVQAAEVSSNRLSTGMIILIVFLVLFVCCVIILITICIIKERARRKLMHLDLDGGQQLEMQQNRVY